MQLNQSNKQLVWNFWRQLGEAECLQAVNSFCHSNLSWYGPAPFNELQGPEDFFSTFWQPLVYSFPDLKRETFIFMGGRSNGQVNGDISGDGHTWVSGTGTLNGTFTHDYLSIPATGDPVKMRWGEFCKVQENKITEIFYLLDFIDLMQQAGIDVLPPSLGADGIYSPPDANDGVMFDVHDSKNSAYSLAHIRRFLFDGLNSYDQDNLSSMGMVDFFHPGISWYGPGGIGACFGLKEFEDFHQRPWLNAYPDRKVMDIDALFAEGDYSAAAGWADVIATHTGEYKGVEATGSRIEFNGLDWWKRDGEVFIENWVFVDMIHLFKQLGIDLFENMQQKI